MQGWEGIVARLDGPLHFRFIMQPSVASILAIIDGVKDARMGEPAYFWALIVDHGHRIELIKEGWKSIFKVFILAMVLEVVYQVMTHHLEYRGYFLVAAFALAIVPYLLLRGPTNRLVQMLRKKG
jgi:hypothetical protein